MDRVDAASRDASAEAAVRVAARAARGLWLGEAAFGRSVTAVEAVVRTWHRALQVVERRTLALRTSPLLGGGERAHGTSPLPSAEAIDPWAVDPARVEQATRVVSVCPGCHGNETTTCVACSGTARVRCVGCEGTGAMPARPDSTRCSECDGAGVVRCAGCHRGRVPCMPCGASGRVHAWLALHVEEVRRVWVHPRDVLDEERPGLRDAGDFDRASFPDELIADSGPRAGDCESPFGAQVDPRTERVRTTRVQSFRSRSWNVGYRTALGEGAMTIGGEPLGVRRGSTLGPLRLRRRVLRAAVAVSVLGAVAGYALHAGRHEWFARHGSATALLGLLLLAGASLVIALEQRLRAAPARTVTWMRAATAAGCVGVALAYVVGWAGRPRPAAVRADLASGEVSRAELAARALVELSIDEGEGAVLLDETRLERMRRASSAADAAAVLGERWCDAGRRTRGEAMLRARVEAEADEAARRGDLVALERLAAVVPVGDRELAASLSARRALGYAADALAHADVTGAVIALHDARQRRAPLRETEDLERRTAESAAGWLRASLERARRHGERREALADAVEAARAITRMTGEPSTPSIDELTRAREGQGIDELLAGTTTGREGDARRRRNVQPPRDPSNESGGSGKSGGSGPTGASDMP